MADRADEIAAYEAQLARTYAPELTSLADRFETVGSVVNTGGGCTAIEAVIGMVPGTDHPLVLVVTTTDPGLADNRADIMHWSVGIYDGDEGGDYLAEGHHVESFDAAVESAVRNLEGGIVSTPGDLCDCEPG
ncbi:hypothetical protein [Nocardia cyriacigeorgica]|uniref:Uncharacterized protein n=1 Tax=Nocardia cyriacigeorgica TaxID=135487 RepID=A0A5R8NDD0_9NOCA|nr:hypothetical protein [Nocardia cyriacigeorgica]MBF6095717.1 hypothetical protein [Nocardia cyriacigeorgica]TLF73680.1 hypothetical protein FEK34_26700 [Nocardia cyriacigeorgica]TLG10230.1 hypothetical protein FEK35_13580 [Nocardia cyriacigeorgica]